MKYWNKISYFAFVPLIAFAWVFISTAFQSTEITTQTDVQLTHESMIADAITAEIITSPRYPLATTPMPCATITDSGLLWLINQNNRLEPDFIPKNLVSHQGIHLHAMAYVAYNQMQVALKAEGITNLQLASAYRPYSQQRDLFSKKVSVLKSQGYNTEAAINLASETIQHPGASEHQTGLALDVTVTGDLTQAFADTKAGMWLATHSHRFGFIIRYQKYKTDITQITYEPWHLRYVGVPHATIMFENNLALEEYAQFVKQKSTYIVNETHESSNVLYLIIYSDTWPSETPKGLVCISSLYPVGETGYILTIRPE